MRMIIGLAAAVAALATTPPPAGARENVLSAQERARGWRLLFNGRDLAGWRSFDGSPPPPGWTVREGVLMLTTDGGRTGGADLVSAGMFGAFELTLEWRVERGGNSGILYLARHVAGAPQPYQTGLEMQVLDDAGHADGRIPTHRAGALYDLTVPPAGAARPAGQWNRARVLVAGGRVRQWLNGVPTADVAYGDATWRRRVAASKFAAMPLFGTFASGVIALQDHGDPVAYRNIKLRRLGAAAR